MPARFFSRSKKIRNYFFRSFKIAFLSLFLFLTLFANVASVLAQNVQYDDTYKDYETLFSQKDADTPLFTRSQWLFDSQTNPTKVTGVSFTFKGKFSLTSQRHEEWFWDHVVSLGNQKDNAFLVRICPKSGATLSEKDKSNCIFQSVPYGDYPLVPQGCTALSSTLASCQAALDQIYLGTIYRRALHASKDASGSISADVGDALVQFGVNIPVRVSLNAGTYQSDLWYCPGNPEVSSNDSPKPPVYPYIPIGPKGDERIEYFANKCTDNRGYFRIGNPVTFQYPPTIEQAISNTDGGQVATGTDTTEVADTDVMPHCHILNGWGPGTGSFVGCIAYLFYYGVFWPLKWFAGIMGNLFDFFLGYSLDDASYRADFAVTGWKLVRDISNIFFILILVYTGLAAVFDFGNISMKKVIPSLIINALIINFSLFATRVVIDISNVAARLFYNVIKVERKDDTGALVSANNDGPGGYKPLSEKILSGFDPQRIIQPNLLTNKGLQNGGGLSDEASTIGDDSKERENPLNTNSYATTFIIISLIAALMVFSIAVMFWKTTFFFLGRTIGLYLTMIFSPFAFVTRGNIPLIGSLKQLKWDDWTSELTKHALLAPIFMMFLYVVYLVINSDFIRVVLGRDTSGGFMEVVLSITIPLLIVYFMIKKGVDFAENYAGEIGKDIQGFANKTVGNVGGIVGGGVGLAAGGAAFLGRNAIARPLGVVAKKTGLQTWAASNQATSRFARWTNAVINKNQTGSWDARNLGVKIGKKEFTLDKTIGKGVELLGEKYTDKISGKIGFENKKKGIQQIDKDRSKAKAESLKKDLSFGHLSDSDAKEVWKKYREKQSSKRAEENWRDHIDEEAKVKPATEEVKRLEKEAADLRTKIETDRAANNTAGVAANETLLQTKMQEKEAASTKLEGLRLQTIKELEKENAYKTSTAYQEALKEEGEKLDKYGKVENAKSLASAMRAVYAEKLRQESFWMKDGKIKEVPLRGLGLSTGAMTAASFAPVLGPAFGAAFANYIQSNADIMDAATNSIISEHKKNTGKGGKLAKLLEKLDKANKDIQEAINNHSDPRIKGKKIDDLSEDDIDEAISEAMANHQVKIDTLTEELKRSGLDTDTKKQKEKERARLRQKMDRWKNAQANREKAQEDIDKHNEKTKKDEDDKSKGDKGGEGKDEKK